MTCGVGVGGVRFELKLHMLHNDTLAEARSLRLNVRLAPDVQRKTTGGVGEAQESM